MASGKIGASNPIVIVDTTEISFTGSTSLAFTGGQVTVPAHSIYGFDFWARYATDPPSQTAVAYNNKSNSDYHLVNKTAAGHCSISGYTDIERTFYFYAKYPSSYKETYRIKGWYKICEAN